MLMILVQIKDLKKPSSHIRNSSQTTISERLYAFQVKKKIWHKMLKGRDQNFFGETEELQHISPRVNVGNTHKQTLQPGTKSGKDD